MGKKSMCIVALMMITTAWGTLLATDKERADKEQEFRRLPVKVYRDKMKAGWIGQIAGVSWGAPTEFRWSDKIIPENEISVWKPEMINDAFQQDDLYVEMTFLRTLENYGMNASIRQAGIDFANSEYPLWCANNAGRTNLRAGIAPPDSSHPKFNRCPNDIDYQIEADYSGLIAPGMPNAVIDLGNKFGRLMNYGDGVYGGQFIGGMYCEAFFEDDILKVIDAGLKCIPAESQYAEMVRDVVAWYKANPDDWEATWKLCQKKYREDPAYQKASNGGIDVKINGAYVLIGLLYGKGDFDKTIILATRCGQDSDCNPSSAAGILFATVGFDKLPPRFTEKLDLQTKFSHTAYNIPGLMDVCEKLARQFIVREGGRIEKDANGEEVFVIPLKAAKPNANELSWAPGPIAGSMFTAAENAQIKHKAFRSMEEAVANKFPGWIVAHCGTDMDPGLHENELGKQSVLVTHPLDRDTACVLSTEKDIPAGKQTTLRAVVGHHPTGDWDLVVRVNGSVQKTVSIDKAIAPDGWTEVTFDLTPFAGNKNVKIELENKPTGWSFEGGYWDKIEITSR
ncbi:MAG: ADP-ribosylglycohydrolase family protein [Planctomycetaceae bacterium]|nr:ADP-ribosylglycohydrolase family protein [Planctomycetaceae bacterium]